MRFACCHLVTLGACVLLRKVSVGKSFEWKTSDACGKTCNVPCVVPDSICLLKTEKTGRYLCNQYRFVNIKLSARRKTVSLCCSSFDFPLENRAHRSISKGSVQIREHQPFRLVKNTYPVRACEFCFLSSGIARK